MIVETVAFIPYTPHSALKKRLQEADDNMTTSVRRPRVRFVEKAGGTMVTEVGRPNPWKADLWYPREDCAACQGRAVIEKEKEDQAIAAVTGQTEGKVNIPKKEQVALPGCTREGIVYILECLTCQREGRKSIMWERVPGVGTKGARSMLGK